MFLHRDSGTLILNDLIENFEPSRLPRAMRLLVHLAGSLDLDGKAPLDMRLTYLGRKRIARACLARMPVWRPRRVILARGRCYLRDGEAELRRAFRWLA